MAVWTGQMQLGGSGKLLDYKWRTAKQAQQLMNTDDET